MLLTDRALKLLAAAAVPAILAVWWPQALIVLAAADGVVLAACAADWLLARRARRGIALTRQPAASLSAGVAQPIGLSVENVGARAAQLELRQVLPPHVEVRRAVTALSAPAGVRTVAREMITPKRRGTLDLGDVHVRLTGPLGLARTQWRVALPARVPVLPNLAAIARLDRVFAVGAREAHSVRRQDYTAEGFEFESLRDYVRGDDSRHIDWKSTAKRHRVTARQYEIERSQRVMIALDCGRLMRGEVRGVRRLDIAVNAAVLLAYVASLRDDYLGLMAFAADVQRFIPPKKGRRHFRDIVKAVADLEPAPYESNYGDAFSLLEARVRRRTLVVVMTDLVDPDASRTLIDHLVHLRRRHLPLCVSIRDESLHETATRAPSGARDVYAGMVSRTLLSDARRAMAVLQSRGCLAREARAGELSTTVVQAYLHVKRRNLL